ncbi:tRNA (adenosine(37)-N6)-threonylcarbamoyltransferase complex ATPase subunit type 1 TsaE [Silvanigrella aquatica]|uniref:tRNA threonylcarbamoyladenosine biosynthesis protein TsaE n=1 Tax=Silvanigrella aquatica TaxID=1915309 RepID=A0A1L4D3I1_9BACT|nr:tRNA (adenosine(37)-N6)-threonylcarbamoyltransferase complex ATPase subunit type 1 TsaE [Silvanigrella aquatica]APJ04758.1 tRNA (adenosine(37)-N6)-threonylcarbamoyltransferase complex ATPase subunit type 1 TsaE [Silvanigrella aquatica]
MINIENFKLNFNNLLSDITIEQIQIELSLNELSQFMKEFTLFLKAGDWIFLDGDLGSGKTAFTKELSICLGAEEFSVSPTFSILNIENLNPNKGLKNINQHIKKLIHLDLYRLKSGKELNYLGLENEFQSSSTICVFEWPYNVDEDDFNKFFSITQCPRPKRILEIFIELSDAEDKRIYSFQKK